MFFPRLKSFWFFLLFAGVLVGAGAKASDTSEEEEVRGQKSLTRQFFIKTQAETLQGLLKIQPKAEGENVITFEFEPPFDFLDRQGAFFPILQEKEGFKKLEKAKQLILKKEQQASEADSKKGNLVFYFCTLFRNALMEQKESPFLVDYDWHTKAYQNILNHSCDEPLRR